jgi:hypothetical protein
LVLRLLDQPLALYLAALRKNNFSIPSLSGS